MSVLVPAWASAWQVPHFGLEQRPAAFDVGVLADVAAAENEAAGKRRDDDAEAGRGGPPATAGEG